MLSILLVLCLLPLAVLALSLAKVRAQTGKKEQIQSPRDGEHLLRALSASYAAS